MSICVVCCVQILLFEMRRWIRNQCYTNTQGNSSGGRLHLMSLTTPFNKSENFASFRSKIWQRKGSRGRARILFTSFSSFGLSRSTPQKERETFSRVFPPSSIFCFFVPFLFLFWRQISRIKYGSHMLLLTIGIHRSTGPTATQTDGQKEEEGRRRRQRGEQFLRVRCGGEYTVPLRAVSHSSVWESLCKLNETVIPIELN